MLTIERQQMIMKALSENGVVKLQELVDLLGASESTIRRDLAELEKRMQLKRVHGGAEALQSKRFEPTLLEKKPKHALEKQKIGKYAATLVQNGSCIFVDAGSTTLAFIEALGGKDIIVVTNGIAHLQAAIQQGIEAYIVGGRAKSVTGAVVGRAAVDGLMNYRFDQCFIGANGVHHEAGFTTPDPEEAMVKERAQQLANESYVLIDQSKFSEVYFSHMFGLEQATIITNNVTNDIKDSYGKHTTIKEV